MALSKIFSSLSHKLSDGPFVTEEPNLPSGGHSGYRPEDLRTQSRRARSQAKGYSQQTGGVGAQPLGYTGYGSNGYQGTAPQPVAGGTGSMNGYPGSMQQTGMNGYPGSMQQSGMNGYPGPMQQTGMNGYPGPMQQSGMNAYPGMAMNGYPGAAPQAAAGVGMAMGGYAGAAPQGAFGMGAAPGPQGYAYQGAPQPAQPKPAPGASFYSMDGYSGAVPQPADNGYQQNWPQREQKPYQSKFRRGSQPERGRRSLFQRGQENRGAGAGTRDTMVQPPVPPVPQNPVEEQPVRSEPNITYMPNLFVAGDGAAYRHVERLTQPMSASTCYRLIEFMRNGETVIVNTELIQDERENQRCLDLLYGAAYTMNCSFTRISVKSIYLIAPASVSVISYESLRQMNEQDQAVRWPAESAIMSGSRPKHTPVFGGMQRAE